MRPVQISSNPPEDENGIKYDEEQQKEITVVIGKDTDEDEDDDVRRPKKLRKIKKTKGKVIEELNELVDKWVDAGAKTKWGTIEGKKTKILVFDEDSEQNKKDQKKYKKYSKLLKNGNHNWGEARKALINSIGQYCSYCGSPIFSHLHIEHILPKSLFPKYTFSWENFILSCPTCNSSKGSNPNQKENSKDELLKTNEAINLITNKTVPPSINYLWPNFNWDNLKSDFFPYKYVLKEIAFDRKRGSKNQFQFTDLVTSTKSKELFEQFKNGTLELENGKFFYLDGRTKIYFGIQITPNDVCSDEQRKAAQNIIDIIGLNSILRTKETSKSIDRRIEMRTRAYFMARQVMKHLNKAYKTNDSKNIFPFVLEQAKKTIAAVGFWGIWFQVLPPVIGEKEKQTLLKECFEGTSNTIWSEQPSI